MLAGSLDPQGRVPAGPQVLIAPHPTDVFLRLVEETQTGGGGFVRAAWPDCSGASLVPSGNPGRRGGPLLAGSGQGVMGRGRPETVQSLFDS